MNILENYTWLKKIESSLLDLNEFPLMRSYAPFDFEKLSNLLQKRFALNSISIEVNETNLLKADELKNGFSDNVNYLSFIFSNLEGFVYLIIDVEDIAKITNELLSSNQAYRLSTTLLEESFFRYAALQALDALSEMNLFQDLSAKMVETTEALKQDSLCIDIKIKINDITSFARIAITNEFRKAWEKYFFANLPLKSLELSKSLQLHISACIGHVQLNYPDLKKIKKGDFIILDEISYDIKHQKAKAVLKLQDTNLFTCKITQNQIKIVDFAQISEENFMPNFNKDNFYLNENKESESKEEPIEEKLEVDSEIPIKKLENMPITVVVEAARFKMSLDKLMNTQPGNIIDLKVNPQQQVNLVVNGQKIAQAELINLGNTLGVRITDIG